MKQHRCLFTWPTVLALLAAGCANPSHLVFQQKTILGVDASTDTTTGRIHVNAGYHRETNTFVPRTKGSVPGKPLEHEAMSVISLNDIKVKFPGTHEVNEQFATGLAAQSMAENPDALGQLTTLSDIAPTPTPSPLQP